MKAGWQGSNLCRQKYSGWHRWMVFPLASALGMRFQNLFVPLFRGPPLNVAIVRLWHLRLFGTLLQIGQANPAGFVEGCFH
jgi:hypothetical protein